MKKKRIAIIAVTSIAVAVVGIGTALYIWNKNHLSSETMVKMIDEGQQVEIVVNKPTYEIKAIKGTLESNEPWIQLDQLKTYNEQGDNYFRDGFDELFNTIKVLESNKSGKNGCMYVVNVDGVDYRSGNATLADGLRNEVFIKKYWNTSNVQDKLNKLGDSVYTDISSDDSMAVYASLNAYYDLLNDAKTPNEFNGTRSLSREEFMATLYKSANGVQDLQYTPQSDPFTQAVGGETEYTKYAKEVDKYSFLQTSNKSLYTQNIKGIISRVEAVYMLVQQNFPDKLAEQQQTKTPSQAKAFKDTKKFGGVDLALTAGFKEKVKDPATKKDTIVEKQGWQAYTLTFMLQNPDKGMQKELYDAMVVAKEVGIIQGDESRWDESLSKAEALELIVNTQIAKNGIYGYATTSEKGLLDLPAHLQGEDGERDGFYNGGAGPNVSVRFEEAIAEDGTTVLFPVLDDGSEADKDTGKVESNKDDGKGTGTVESKPEVAKPKPETPKPKPEVKPESPKPSKPTPPPANNNNGLTDEEMKAWNESLGLTKPSFDDTDDGSANDGVTGNSFLD